MGRGSEMLAFLPDDCGKSMGSQRLGTETSPRCRDWLSDSTGKALTGLHRKTHRLGSSPRYDFTPTLIESGADKVCQGGKGVFVVEIRSLDVQSHVTLGGEGGQVENTFRRKL